MIERLIMAYSPITWLLLLLGMLYVIFGKVDNPRHTFIGGLIFLLLLCAVSSDPQAYMMLQRIFNSLRSLAY